MSFFTTFHQWIQHASYVFPKLLLKDSYFCVVHPISTHINLMCFLLLWNPSKQNVVQKIMSCDWSPTICFLQLIYCAPNMLFIFVCYTFETFFPKMFGTFWVSSPVQVQGFESHPRLCCMPNKWSSSFRNTCDLFYPLTLHAGHMALDSFLKFFETLYTFSKHCTFPHVSSGFCALKLSKF